MAEEQGSSSEEKKGGGKGKIIVLFLILLLGGGGAAAYFFILKPAQPEKTEEIIVIHEGPPPLEKPKYLPLGNFFINLSDGKYTLRINITLVFAEQAPIDWLSNRNSLVKDMVIGQLEILTAEQLDDPRTRTLLRKDLLIKLNSLFPNDPIWKDPKPIKKVLFHEFLTQ